MRSTILLLLLALVLACSAAAANQSAADRGRFVVKPPEVESAAWRAEARSMQDSGTLQELASALNDIFVLPHDIGLRYVECGEANAYYNAETYEIQMCLELMQNIAETLAAQYDDDAVADAAAGAYIATALHEVGHALVHVLEIPVTGREEDAVDQLSAWMLIEADDVGSVLGAAATYYNDDEVGDEDFGNEHSLDKQRYFNLVCWAYGSDPENSQELLDVWELPEDRAAQCVDEYAQLNRSWSRLLQDHLRDEEVSGTATSRTSSAPKRPIAPTQDGAPIVGRVKSTAVPKEDQSRRYQPANSDGTPPH